MRGGKTTKMKLMSAKKNYINKGQSKFLRADGPTKYIPAYMPAIGIQSAAECDSEKDCETKNY